MSHILVVDDNRESALLLCELLEMEGHDAVAAFDAQDALAQCSARPWRLMLLDLQLPDMSGVQLAHQLRARLQPAPMLVALSGFGASDLRADEAAPFDRFLSKPIDLEALSALLADLDR